ncbi:hypothetical protein HMF8227_02376 [Saliniradius amylolyticus]|uniref:Uncharacterized protein n=1 Tax=Saliniradius amylolyticus TaxID=2183582 RepID=A0A2S2E596_9ALTE|nr:hypothetical protein [Saliniradius amylolyticus]AWL12828.1 hypothetical protein HMF8227_02376 [Saliniradius amylolyticus]
MTRQSAKDRLRLSNVAEREIQKYAGDHALWHKHIHNVELDSAQILKMVEMDNNPNTIDFSCRRTGKTAVKEMYFLEHNALNADQEGGIVAPREAQSLVNLGYHLDAIRRSDALSAYIAHKSGRRQLADTYYEFNNRSKAQAYGIMANVDGGDLTWASLEEVDDMPADRLYSRFLLMMGSTRRLGASKHSRNDPQIRITGVFKGADTLSGMVESGMYHCLPPVDCYLGIELGILNEQFILKMRKQLPPEEFIRQLLCRNVAAKNLIWEKWIRSALQLGVKTNLQPAEPEPYLQYKKRGVISFGYDHLGHGEDPTSSKSSLVVLEQVHSFTVCIFAYTWPAGTDEAVIQRDLVRFWRYFRPDFALGDAFGIGLLTSVNDDLFKEGLTGIDRRSIGEGESTASTWPEWAFSPIRFEGMVKHQMASSLASAFRNNVMVLIYCDDRPDDPDTAVYQSLVKQLANIKPVNTTKSYSSYKMVKTSIGDDLFDAMMAANWALVTQGAASAPAIVTVKQRNRQELLQPSGFQRLTGNLR